ncbi:hypothetical protein LAZ67_14002099 [Cordylochernes scorpioides]|uniref:Reverse transcriptase domain-containing protein n=1 Tax=Cordylochernes scorpioides TaxID=51811 RepID=A0ABY6L7R3_9ARAC|nr:hypothetical protein LAZ67_14002099 [Cordylochernes scorpioides]
MSLRKILADDLKWRAVGRMEAGQSQVEVAKWLNVNKSVVSKIRKQFIETGTIKRKEGSGRKRKTATSEDRYLVVTAKRHREMTAIQLSNELSSATGTRISRQTVYRRLHEGALYARRPMVCIPLTSAHRRARLNWCLEHHAWTRDQWWVNVLFSDESRFSSNTDSRRVFIWRESGTRYHPKQFPEICQQENIKLNYKKCEFLKTSIEFLGYTVKNGTYTPQTRNLDIINAIKTPFNQKTLQFFLGAVNVYNKFIPDYARLRTPLNKLLKKDTKWQWDDKCQQAITVLKESLIQSPYYICIRMAYPAAYTVTPPPRESQEFSNKYILTEKFIPHSITKARQLAFSRTQLKHERNKQSYDKGHQTPHFEIGDLVLVKNYKHPDTGKLAPYFTGCRVFQYLSAPWKTFQSSHKIQAVVVEAEWKVKLRACLFLDYANLDFIDDGDANFDKVADLNQVKNIHLTRYVRYGKSNLRIIILSLLLISGIESNPGPKATRQTTIETSMEKDLRELIAALTVKIDDWGSKIESRLSSIELGMQRFDARVQQLESSLEDTTCAVASNAKKISEFERRVEFLEMKNREKNLVFYGIEGSGTETSNESCVKIKILLKDNMQIYDEIDVSKCWRLSKRDEAPILVEVSEHTVKPSNRGRSSGGILVGIRKEIHGLIYKVEIEPKWISVILKLASIADSPLVCAIFVYLPPSELQLENLKKLFCYVENKMQQGFEIVLGGDLNIRIGYLGAFHNLFQIPVLLSGYRTSRDPTVSPLAETLVDFLDDNSLTILNGRSISDKNGCYTFISHQGSSVLDLFMVSPALLEIVLDLSIESLPYSDHLPLLLKLNGSDNTKAKSLPLEYIPVKKFTWSINKASTYELCLEDLNALQLPEDASIDLCADTLSSRIQTSMGSLSPPQRIVADIPTLLIPIDAEISLLEIAREIASLKNNKAAGYDSIPNEDIKALPDNSLIILSNLFNKILIKSQVPSQWSKTIIQPIFKNGDPNAPSNYRGIALISNLSKLFTSILKNRLSNWIENRKLITENQAGFRSGYSCQDHIFTLTSLIQMTLSRKRRKLYAFFVDLKKAFDTVPHLLLWRKLALVGLSGRFIKLIQNYYAQMMAAVRWNGSFTEFIKIQSGVLQGEPLSPYLFIIFINDLVATLDDSEMPGIYLPGHGTIHLLLFADDIVLFGESKINLQIKINLIKRYFEENGLTLNQSKSKIVVFRNGCRLARSDVWFWGQQPLTVSSKYTYLGYPLTTKNPTAYVAQHFKSKALVATNAVWRILSKSRTKSFGAVMKLLDSIVLSTLLYSPPPVGDKSDRSCKPDPGYFPTAIF